MASYKIKSVTIQGMRNVERKTYNLSNATYLHGPNGAGKSTVLNAVQLCLLGYIPGISKNNAAIMQNANCNKMEVSILMLDDSANECEVARTFELKGSKVSSSIACYPESLDIKNVVGDCELPVFNWDEFNSLTANKLKDWFIKFLPDEQDAEINWEGKLEACLSSDPVYCKNIVTEYSDAFSKIKKQSAIECIAEANGIIKENLSYSKAVLSEKENALNGMQDALDCIVDEVALQKAKTQYTLASSKAEDAVKQKDAAFESLHLAKNEWSLYNKATSNAPLRQDIEQAQNQVNQIKKEKCDCQSEVSIKQDAARLYDSKLMELNAVKKVHMEKIEYLKSQSLKDVCPITGNACKEASLAFKKYQSDIDAANDELNALKKDVSDASVKKAQATSELALACQAYKEQCNSLNEAELKLSELLKKQNAARLAVAPECSIDDAQSAFDEACKQFAECKSQELEASNEVERMSQQLKYKSLIDKAVADKYMLEEKISILKKWEKLTSENGMQTDYSKNQFESLEKHLGEHIEKTFQDGSTCKIKVSNKANSFSFGVNRNGSYIPYRLLSTGEQALYAFSLMLYMCKQSSAQLKIVLMDDFFDHLDSNRFDSLMSCISTDLDDVQILMAGVNKCNSRFVKQIEISR